jgi:putative membrane-bound dehydrogenase-like protein
MNRLAIVLFTASIALADTPKIATHQLKLDEHTFTLPVGFTIEKVADRPLVDRPIVASFDDRGRLYVADSSGSNEKVVEQLKNPTHRIVRLEDTDGDGKFDKSTVFADKMMFPEGILWHRGHVYCGAPPHIWKLTDTDDDGKADKREIWFDGKTLTGCANDLHGPYLGPDGWIYWTKGAFAKQEYTLHGGKKFTTRASHIFRARPDGTGIEPVMTGGMDNPVDVAFLPNGERFFTTTFFQHPAAGQRDGLIHAIYGGIYGKDHDVIHDPDHKWTSPNLMPVMTHMGPAAPCGLHCYQDSGLGSAFEGNLFACQFNLRKVSRHILKPKGSTYTTEDSDFVVSDNTDFHPTDVIEDADGSLLIVNTGGWYKLCCPSSQLVKEDVLGAIYRVRTKEPRAKDELWTSGDWEKKTTRNLMIQLTDAWGKVGWPQERCATEALASRGDKAFGNGGKYDGLRFILNDPNSEYPENWRRCIRVATRIDSPAARAFVREIVGKLPDTTMSDKGIAEVEQAAIHSMGLWRDRDSVPSLLKQLESKNLVSRRMAVEALGRIGDKAALPAILKALEAPDVDRSLQHALTYALIEIGVADGIVAGLKSKSVLVRQSCLIALDQVGGKLDVHAVLALLKSDDTKAMAQWILGRHPEWADELAKVIRKRFPFDLVDVLPRYARVPSVESALLEILADERRDVIHYPKLYALAVLRHAGGKELPPTWVAAIAKAIRTGGGWFEVQSAAIHVLRAFPPVKATETELARALEPYITHKEFLPERRLEAMSVYPGGMRDMATAEFDLILTSLDREQKTERRGLAAEVVSRAKLKSDQLGALIATLPKVSPLELDRVLAAFAQTKDDEIGKNLVAALNDPTVRPALRVDGVKERIKHFGPAVHADAEKLYAALNKDYEQQRARLDEAVKTLKTGDIRRGQALFNSSKTSCIACHTIGYVGGKQGPDLTRIGGIRTERDLLESILFPSASFVRSYEPVTVTTKDEKTYTGVPKKDAPDEMVLVIAADKEVRIRREDIEEVRPGKVSIMPDGLDKQLTAQELADLIAFLRACK